MKKLFTIFLCILFIAGCANQSTNNDDKDKAKEVTGTAKTDEVEGKYVVVDVKLKDNKLTSVSMDETGAKSADGTRTGTKKELGDAYGMKAASPIKKEWYEQIKSLEDYIVANGVDAVKVEDGKVTNDDLKTSVTISVDKFIDTTKKAIENAK